MIKNSARTAAQHAEHKAIGYIAVEACVAGKAKDEWIAEYWREFALITALKAARRVYEGEGGYEA